VRVYHGRSPSAEEKAEQEIKLKKKKEMGEKEKERSFGLKVLGALFDDILDSVFGD